MSIDRKLEENLNVSFVLCDLRSKNRISAVPITGSLLIIFVSKFAFQMDQTNPHCGRPKAFITGLYLTTSFSDYALRQW